MATIKVVACTQYCLPEDERSGAWHPGLPILRRRYGGDRPSIQLEESRNQRRPLTRYQIVSPTIVPVLTPDWAILDYATKSSI